MLLIKPQGGGIFIVSLPLQRLDFAATLLWDHKIGLLQRFRGYAAKKQIVTEAGGSRSETNNKPIALWRYLGSKK